MPRFRAACLATTALFVTLSVSACKKPEAAAADVRTRETHRAGGLRRGGGGC